MGEYDSRTLDEAGVVGIRSKSKRIKLHLINADSKTLCRRYDVSDLAVDMLPAETKVAHYSMCGVCAAVARRSA